MAKLKASKNGQSPKADELLDSLSRAKNAVDQFTAMLHYHQQTTRLLEFNLEDAKRAVKELEELENDQISKQTSIHYDHSESQIL